MSRPPFFVQELTVWNTATCNLRCKYCLPRGTRILMADLTWKPIEEIRAGQYVIGVRRDSKCKHLRLVKSKVIAVVSRRDLIYGVTADRGVIYLTDNHPILSPHSRWLAINPKRADVKSYTLKVGHKLRYFATPLDTLNNFNEDYMKGYLYGVFIGDGCYTEYHYFADPDKPYLVKYGYTKPVKRVIRNLRLAVKDESIINRAKSFLEKLGFEYRVGEHKYRYKGSTRTLPKITIYKKEIINSILNPSYDDEKSFLKGFIAGFFDTEGSFTGILRISNRNLEVLNELKSALEFFGFTVKILTDKDSIYDLRISSGFNDIVKFINLFRPAVTRKFGKVMEIHPRGFAKVLKIEPLGEAEVFNIQTETENYIAEGFIVHNCFVYKLYENQPKKWMDKDTADQLIHFAQHRLSPNGSIWFFGGEPLSHFESMKYITERAYAEGANWRVGLTTNCTLITEEIAKWMGKYNYGILCSLDGVEAKHDKYRIHPDGHGSWKEAWRGVQLVRKYVNPNPQIRWTFGPDTTEGLAEDIKLFVETYGLTNLATDAVYEVKWYPEDLAKLRIELEKFKKYYRVWMEQGKPVFSMFVRDANLAVTANTRHWQDRCGLGTGSVGIDIDGTIYPCHRFVSSRNIKTGHVSQGFNVARVEWIEKWRKLPPYSEVPKRCLDCKFRKACIGGCLAVNYDLFGDPHIVPQAFCDIKNLTVEVLGKMCLELQNNEIFQSLFGRGLGTRTCIE